ncbi:MAG: DNA polymerase III subunit beta [Caulobacteraceae bacterium]|nr:MAG: DNA polymerase III subunit beta [Caulobacteraceae bacterium]
MGTTRPSRTATLQGLRALEGELRAQGLRSLYVFGSVARDDATIDSDVDVFADFEPGARLGWDFAGVPALLARRLERRVDFTTRDALHPLLRADIEREAIRVF